MRGLMLFLLSSSFLKARNCLDKMMLSSLSTSFVGFCLPDDRKVCTTIEVVSLTAPSANVLKRESNNLLLLTAMANAPSNRILSC